MFSFRQFRQDDAEAVRRLFTQGQRQFSAGAESEIESYVKDSLAGDLADIAANYLQSGGNFWVVETEGQVVGMVALQRKDAATCELRRMAVDARYRRKGLGRRLLETAEAFARQQGYAGIVLTTITPLQPAIALYEGMGYKLTDQSRHGAVTVLHYRKELFNGPNGPGNGQS
jgi:GNAT superfamily N-acetyltransferase